MRSLLLILVLLAPVLSGETPAQTDAEAPRNHFPTDYQRNTTCTSPAVCQSFNQSQFADVAALRGYDIGQEWVDSHWKELTAAMQPMCERISTCYATPANDSLFCNDLGTEEALPICERYPAGSSEREKCTFFVGVYMAGVDRNARKVWEELQACAKAQQPATPAERTLDYWITPPTIGLDGTAKFIVYALDSESRVPIQAKVQIESKDPIYASDSPDGLPTAFYPVNWQPKLVRIPNANGHRDLVAPEVTLVAPGYRAEKFRLPIEVPVMKVEMNPPAAKLKRGRNKVTITAVDIATGKPVEARVMGGEMVLGKTNEPFELEVSGKRPEIWVTSLYDRYSDVVVAPAVR